MLLEGLRKTTIYNKLSTSPDLNVKISRREFNYYHWQQSHFLAIGSLEDPAKFATMYQSTRFSLLWIS
jgi:hypothetical protein